MSAVNTVLVATCAPDVALNVLINLERMGAVATIAGCCVWCDKASDGTHYPAPFPDILEEHPKNFFTACCQEHADVYREHYMALSDAVLKRDPEVK